MGEGNRWVGQRHWLRVREKLQLFGEAEDGPGKAAGPGAEGGIALLGVGAAIMAVVHVEDAFVGDASAHIVGVAPFAVIDAELRGRLGMFDEALEEEDFLIM